MNFELVTIRVVHILVGVIWAGSAIFLAGFLDPRLRALGPDVHRRVLAALYVPLRFVLEGGGAITILVGIALVFRLQRIDDLLDTNWGWAITIGLVTSVIAHTTGVLALTSLKKLSGADEAGGRPPVRPGDDAGAHDGGAGHDRRCHDGGGEVRGLRGAPIPTFPQTGGRYAGSGEFGGAERPVPGG